MKIYKGLVFSCLKRTSQMSHQKIVITLFTLRLCYIIVFAQFKWSRNPTLHSSPASTFSIIRLPISSISSRVNYSLPFCRKEATPQYFILNLAGSSVSVKEPIISAQTSQLLQPGRNKISCSNLTADLVRL